MCGFSAAIPESKDDRLYIGAPGVYYWQGSLFVQNINEQEQRPNTPDGPAHTDHNMLGRRALFLSASAPRRDSRNVHHRTMTKYAHPIAVSSIKIAS